MALSYPNLASLSKNARLFSVCAAKQQAVRSAPASTRLGEAAKDGTTYKPRQELKTSKVNNLIVSSVETNRPTSKLAVYFRAGTRFEDYTNRGVVHQIKICSGLGTKGASWFGTTRHIDQAGGNLTCQIGREHISYTLEATRDKINSLTTFLEDTTCNYAFKPWEIKDNINRLKLERLQVPFEFKLMELLHLACFRKGLGNSLHCPEHMIGTHTSDMLLDYCKKNYGEACVAAIGMPHDQVCDFAARLSIKTNTKTSSAEFCPNNDIRESAKTDFAFVALGMEGASLMKPKDMVIASLIHRAMGAGSRVGFTSHMHACSGISSGNLTSATGRESATSSAFSANYSDIGLMGIFIAATGDKIDAVTRKAVEIWRKAEFSEDCVQRGKYMLKSDILMNNELDDMCLEEIGLQTLLKGSLTGMTEINKLIDSVTPKDMTDFISKSGKMSLAAYGNIGNVPYVDQLCK